MRNATDEDFQIAIIFVQRNMRCPLLFLHERPATASTSGTYALQKPMSDKAKSGHCIYSITLSARARSDDGIVTPSVFAVFKLTTRSNLVACSTGRSPALAPFKMRST